VQAVITAALGGDFSVFEEMVGVLARPFEDQPGAAVYGVPPRADEVVLQTFCGT
jgi:uncharacterized protein YdiU (UPF0061 family)